MGGNFQMGKHKKMKHKGPDNAANILQRERDNSARAFVNFCLIDKNKLEGKDYDFTIIPDIYTLLYGFDIFTILESCDKVVEGTFELRSYRNSKIDNYFKTGQIPEFTKAIVNNVIPERFKGIDNATKSKVRKMLLGYYLLKGEHTPPEDLVVKAIYMGLRNEIDKFTYKENSVKKIEIKAYTQEPLSKETSLIKNMKVFTERNRVKYLNDLIPYFNAYIEGYIDLETPTDSIVAVDKVVEENREIFKILQNLGYEDLKTSDLDNIAQIYLSEDCYKQYQKDIVELEELYYQVVMPISYYISQKELANVLKEERKLSVEQLSKVNEALKSELLENKSLKKVANKADKELSEMKLELQRAKEELAKLSDSKCELDEYKKLKEALAKVEEEKKSLSQEVMKWKNKAEGCQVRIGVLEEKVENYNTLMDNLMELQQENILLQDAISKVEDLTNEIDEKETGVSYEEMLEAIKDLRILFIGGTSNVGTRLREILPNLEFIDISERNFTFGIPETTDCVVMYPRVITHAHTERVYSLVDENMPVIYVNALNSKLVVQEIYTQILNGHK